MYAIADRFSREAREKAASQHYYGDRRAFIDRKNYCPLGIMLEVDNLFPPNLPNSEAKCIPLPEEVADCFSPQEEEQVIEDARAFISGWDGERIFNLKHALGVCVPDGDVCTLLSSECHIRSQQEGEANKEP